MSSFINTEAYEVMRRASLSSCEFVSGELNEYDAVSVASGISDMVENGVSVSNVAATITGALGLAANVAGVLTKGCCFVAGTQVLVGEKTVTVGAAQAVDSGYAFASTDSTTTLCVVATGLIGASYVAKTMRKRSLAKAQTCLPNEPGIRCGSDFVGGGPTPAVAGGSGGFFGRFTGRGSAWGFASVCLFALAIAALCVAFGASDKVKANALLTKSPESVQRWYVTKNIEEIRIGERTLGVNPQGRVASELDESIFQTVPHCGYSLCLTQADGSRCDVELLRPADWLDYEDVRLCRRSDGAVVDEADLVAERMASGGLADVDDYDLEVRLDLPEMGVVGWALLTKIDDEVEIADGSGNIVTGTFAHVADNVLDLVVEGQAEPIGCTSNHPFWSVDRQEFTPAGELRQGERLLLFSGETKRVAQNLPRPGPQVVYNLEVFGEHAYHVATLGVLVHNACASSITKELAEEPTPAEISKRLGHGRPWLRKSTKTQIENAYKNPPDDPTITDRQLPQEYAYGHKAGVEYWRLKRWAYENGLSRKEWNNFCNKPELYKIEDPMDNCSHYYENHSPYDASELQDMLFDIFDCKTKDIQELLSKITR